MPETTHWVHDLDPFLIRLWGDFGIRYYGLAYLLGFVVGVALLRWYYRRGRSPLDPEQVERLLVALVLGVLLGGRLGFILLYALDEVARDPLLVVRIWQGGMASHGGFLGVILACGWAARCFGVRFLSLGDLLCTIVPPGLLLGRIANFINGELWGRVSDAPWAVIFPASAPQLPISAIAPRHPSQLYEAALEGLLLLVFVQWRFWRTGAMRRPGLLAGEFLALYAAVRIFGELFREPDASLILGMSRGIFYSLFLMAGGIGLIIHARRADPVEEGFGTTPVDDQFAEESDASFSKGAGADSGGARVTRRRRRGQSGKAR